MDPRANGQMQKEWGWLIAAYLFLGGVGAGAYAIAAINSFWGADMELSTRVGLWIGFPALLAGCLCLLADLGSPTRAVRAGLRPRTSWIARGFWIISAFMVLALAHLVLFLSEGAVAAEGPDGVTAVVAVLGIVTAVGTMAYTGLLLGAAKGIPFWRSGVVPVVFVVSALVTGHFCIMLGMSVASEGTSGPTALQIMASEAAGLVVIEALAILFFLHSAYKNADARESVRRILRNRMFVIGYFVLGLAVPLLLMIYLAMASDAAGLPTGSPAAAFLGGVLGLAGGLILRWAVLVSGTLPTWNLAGFEFRRNARAREPRPEVGLLPPT